MLHFFSFDGCDSFTNLKFPIIHRDNLQKILYYIKSYGIMLYTRILYLTIPIMPVARFCMTETDLGKLSRKQLLELLLKQTERAEELEKQLSDAERQLEDRNLIKSEAGSIAEASLKLNRVFEAAEAAASQYLENIKKIGGGNSASSDNFSNGGDDRAKELIAEAERICKKRIAETEALCREREAATERICAEKEETLNTKLKNIAKILRHMYTEKKLLDRIFSDLNIK